MDGPVLSEIILERTVRVPEYQGQTFHLVGIEVIGLKGDGGSVSALLYESHSNSPLQITAVETDSTAYGVFKFMLDVPSNYPYVRYKITASNYTIRDINLLGFYTETII